MAWEKSFQISCSVNALFYSPLGADGPVTPTKKLNCDLNGVIGDFHSKMHTLSTVREEAVVDKGSLVLNHRQLTLTSAEECAQIAASLFIHDVLPDDMMSNLHLAGIPNLSTIYPGSFVNFFDAQHQRRQLVILITAVNDPCYIPKDRIETRHGKGSANGFEKAAYNRRGLVGMVYRPGFVKIDDKVVITIPKIYRAPY